MIVALIDALQQSPGSGQALILVGLALLAMWFLMRRSMKRQRNPEARATDRIEHIKQEGSMRNDLRQMMVELEDLTRRFNAQLESRAVQLEKLIAEADSRIAELNRIQGAPGVGPAASPAGDTPPEAPVDARTQQIYGLADSGRSVVEIASELDEQVGTVELILALRQQKQESS